MEKLAGYWEHEQQAQSYVRRPTLHSSVRHTLHWVGRTQPQVGRDRGATFRPGEASGQLRRARSDLRETVGDQARLSIVLRGHHIQMPAGLRNRTQQEGRRQPAIHTDYGRNSRIQHSHGPHSRGAQR
jgi:hypothetical protein